MTEVEIAERIAREAHAGQLDKQGQPYILHVERVAKAVSEPAKAAAWLHDVLEDKAQQWPCLIVQGISVDTAADVACLTRNNKRESYTRYIDQLAGPAGEIAREVKIADLRDNLRDGCPESLRARYHAALARLAKAEA